MEEEIAQLVSMGFPSDLAAQALLATGGPTAKATDWLLSHPTSSPPPQLPPNSQSQQPKLDKFFHFRNPNKRAKCSDSTPISEHLGPTAKVSESSTPSTLVLASEPLAERMRPQKIEQVIGQCHILGPHSLLTSAVRCNRLPSIVLWGPPGTGKTSIAKALANSTSDSYNFMHLTAVTSGVKDVREVVEKAKKIKLKNGKRTVLFVDEVHRFNKSQQDSFLPVIEDGSIVFIGATTENPSFHLVTPLLSRCRVLSLKGLVSSDVAKLLRRAVDDVEIGLSRSFDDGVKIVVDDEVVEFLSEQCDGDARVALNALEVCATTALGRVKNGLGDCDVSNVVVNVGDAKEALQCKHIAYDRAGEEHYNLISALIKSMRGSDGDAAIYWLARMLEGGEQPLFIARRLVVFASEDVGLADPNALLQAVACHQACHIIGMPECRLNLAQCVAYLALAPKSVAAYQALKEAEKVVRESVGGNEGVPLHLRNAPTKLMKDVGYGNGYIYTPDDPTAPQSFLPPSLLGRKFLHWPPGNA